MENKTNMALAKTQMQASTGKTMEITAVKPIKAYKPYGVGGDLEYLWLSSHPYLSYKRVKHIASSNPRYLVGVNVYQLLNQFNKICKNEAKEDQIEIVHSCLLRHKRSKNQGNLYMFMPATEAVACFEGKEKTLPIITFKRSSEVPQYAEKSISDNG